MIAATLPGMVPSCTITSITSSEGMSEGRQRVGRGRLEAWIRGSSGLASQLLGYCATLLCPVTAVPAQVRR